MERRTFLLGLLGSLAVAPTILAAASSVEAAPLPEGVPLTPESLPKVASPSTPIEADLETDWTQAAVRRARRGARRVGRTARRGARRATRTVRRTGRVMRRRGY